MKATVCPQCKKSLPRCAVCLLNLGTKYYKKSVEGAQGNKGSDDGKATEPENDYDRWLVSSSSLLLDRQVLILGVVAGSISVFRAIMECTQDTRENGLQNIRSARFQIVLAGARCSPNDTYLCF